MSEPARRPYRKRKRAESEEETRRRITEAAVDLHGTVGPANTTVTEVARMAGVSRMTVYNHFPTDADLFAACSSHWSANTAFPDPSDWAAIDDAAARVARGLEELYGWYELEEAMLSNVLRDAGTMPVVADVMRRIWEPYMKAAVRTMAGGPSAAPNESGVLHAMLLVAVDFHTWQVLTRSGLDAPGAAALATDMVIGGVGARTRA